MKKGDILIRSFDQKRFIVVDENTGKILPEPGGRDTLSGPSYVRHEAEIWYVGTSGETFFLTKTEK